MWGLWLFPLLLLLFAGGMVAALCWWIGARKARKPNVGAMAAIPMGCVAVSVAGLVLLAAAGSLFQRSDAELYEEIFGYRPTITEDRMIFDDFGRERKREIFMRAQPTPNERRRLLSIPGAVKSKYSLAQFIARGSQHGFMWWMSAEPHDLEYCRAARIIDAPGYRGWTEFRVAECLNAGDDMFAPSKVGTVFVVASGR